MFSNILYPFIYCNSRPASELEQQTVHEETRWTIQAETFQNNTLSLTLEFPACGNGKNKSYG